MDLFGEPELGIDYIYHQYPNGKLTRFYFTICDQCKTITYKPKRGLRKTKDYCSKYCQNKALSINQQGSFNSCWRGGKSSKLLLLRKSPEYREWRIQVFERDDYTCQDCSERGGQLEAHHLVTVAESYDLIFDVDNGRTLCIPCHKLTFGHEIEYRDELALYV